MCELFHTAENFRAAGALLVPAGGARAQFLITGNDEKAPVEPFRSKELPRGKKFSPQCEVPHTSRSTPELF
jgi:hypothetical protein